MFIHWPFVTVEAKTQNLFWSSSRSLTETPATVLEALLFVLDFVYRHAVKLQITSHLPVYYVCLHGKGE